MSLMMKVCDQLVSLVMPNSDPWDGLFSPLHTFGRFCSFSPGMIYTNLKYGFTNFII